MTLSERGLHFEKGGIWSQSWCQYIRWYIRRRVFLKAKIVWRGGEVTTIRIAFCKKNVVIGLVEIGT